jgi:hypothetical protein
VRGPRELRVDACTAGRGTLWELRAASGPEELRDLERTYARTSAPPAAGPAREPWAASGPEELRDSEGSHGCHRRDAVTVCFQSLPQVTVDAGAAIICCCSFEFILLDCGPEYSS